MILTVTLNPSIDISYQLENLALDTVNRTALVSKTAGGKGLNVSRVLKQLEAPLLATGFLAGFHGEFINDQLKQAIISTDFIHVEGETRNSIAILHDDGQQTEILEPGPAISLTDSQTFLEKFRQLAKQVTYIAMSGSLPQGLASDYYSQLIQIAAEEGAKVLLDTSGEALVRSLESDTKPYLIKPNETEVNVLLDQPLNLNNPQAVLEALSQPIFEGIEWLVISMGADGALIKHGNKLYKADIPEIEVVSPVGSGDATIAGFAYSLDKGLNVEECIKVAMTTGMLNSQEEVTGCINVDKFEDLYEQVVVREWI